MQEVSANTQQLNLAARLATSRGIDFQEALETVMTNPAAAQGILNGSNGGGASISDVLAALARGQTMGANGLLAKQESESQSARIAKLEEGQAAIVTEIGRVKFGAQIIGYGLNSHLTQHAQVRAGELEDIDASGTAYEMRQYALENGMTELASQMDDLLLSLPEPKKVRVLEAKQVKGKKQNALESGEEKEG